MGVCLFANDAVASLAAAVATTDTEIPVATGSGALFPSPTGGDFFQAVIYSASTQEIVKVTGRAGDTLTVLRAQENTAALNFAVADKIELRLTAEVMSDMAQASGLGTAASRDIGPDAGQVADGSFGCITGEVKAYAGAAAPAGWLLCQGQEISRTTYAALFAIVGVTYGPGDGATTFNLPNLVDRTVMGSGNKYARGTTGGNDVAQVTVQGHALTPAELPSHQHSVFDPGHAHTVTDPGHTHQLIDSGHTHGVADPGHDHGYTALQAPFNGVNADVGGQPPSIGSQYNPRTSHEGTGIGIYASNANIALNGAYSNVSLQVRATGVTVMPTGGDAAHSHPVLLGTNLPPYVAMNWIIKV